MTQVPTPHELITANDEAIRPDLHSGSAHALPITEAEMAEIAKRRPRRCGFSSQPKKRRPR